MRDFKLDLATRIVNIYEDLDFYDLMDKYDGAYKAILAVMEDLSNPRYRHTLYLKLQEMANNNSEYAEQIKSICDDLLSYNTTRKYVIPPLKVATDEGEISLDVCYMAEIKDYYEKQCLLQYMIDNYNLLELDVIRDIVCKAKTLMDKYGFSDVRAIEETLAQISDVKLMNDYLYGYEISNDFGEILTKQDFDLFMLFSRRLEELNASNTEEIEM